MSSPLLEVRNLYVYFPTRHGVVRAVDGVNFHVDRSEALGIVGESGSGKSVSMLSTLRLIDRQAHAWVSGDALFEGRDLLKISDRELRRIRGARIGMVFQDPLTSLNPVIPVGDQVAEVLRWHKGMGRAAARGRAIELLDIVGIPAAEARIDQFPHEFSGGMRQRIMIAIAIACEPQLLIADEPTTALDVTIQAQILNLLNDLRQRLDMALVLISHDVGVVAAICDRVQVMYGGKTAESGPVATMIEHPQHPYTRGLLRSTPRLDLRVHQRLQPIPGLPVTSIGPRGGCAFAPRCSHAMPRCTEEDPPLFRLSADHQSACWLCEEPQTEETEVGFGVS